VILAGISGTGKSKLAHLFAKAIEAEYLSVPVRPDWSDSTDILGHLDLNGNFITCETLRFIKKAKDNPEVPYILCLDEMNLARVEYYFSDFLSVMETRKNNDGKIITDSLLSESDYGNSDIGKEFIGTYLPENFYIIGTVNMDETTFPFSKKVLDRANTIELTYVNLIPSVEKSENAARTPEKNAFLKTPYLLLKDCGDDVDLLKYCSRLEEINSILKKGSLHVGYRIRDEIVFYMLNNKNAGALLKEEDAFDHAIMQKILPRVQGSTEIVKTVLCELFKYLVGDYSGLDGASVAENLDLYINENSESIKYPKSAEKIAFMIRRFEEDGFTTYWL
jgi:5-methylcytosine-specific restriction endonuclease McrBC GTP-binding regulatory subunit McrB